MKLLRGGREEGKGGKNKYKINKIHKTVYCTRSFTQDNFQGCYLLKHYMFLFLASQTLFIEFQDENQRFGDQPIAKIIDYRLSDRSLCCFYHKCLTQSRVVGSVQCGNFVIFIV